MKPTYTFTLVSGEGGLLRVMDMDSRTFLFQGHPGFHSPEVALQAMGELAHERGWKMKTIYTPERKVDRLEAYESGPTASAGVAAGSASATATGASTSFTVALKISADFDRLLTELAERINGTGGLAIYNGLTLLKAALDARDEGKRLVVVDDEKGTEEDLGDLIVEGGESES